MAKPQSPELRRSGKAADLDPDNIGTRLQAQRPGRAGGRSGPVPEENQPGHHPDHEQDQPDLAKFAAKLGMKPRRSSSRRSDDMVVDLTDDTSRAEPDQAMPAPGSRPTLSSPDGARSPLATTVSVAGAAAATPGRFARRALRTGAGVAASATELLARGARKVADRLDDRDDA